MGDKTYVKHVKKGEETGMSEQFHQVWDWKKNEAHSFHSGKMSADETARRLNAQQAMDWNGLPRYQAMEAND